MIVYIESNFLLEVALEQEQSISAEAILKLAEDSKIELAFPSFALSEPFAPVMHRDNERTKLHQDLKMTWDNFSGQSHISKRYMIYSLCLLSYNML